MNVLATLFLSLALVATVICATVTSAAVTDAPKTPAYPSGFRLEDCEPLLSEDGRAPSLAHFKRLPVREKIRDVHAMAHVLYVATRQAPGDEIHHVTTTLLASEGLRTLGPRLGILRQVAKVRLVPYGDELADITVKLSVLVAMAEQWDTTFDLDLAGYFETVLDVQGRAAGEVIHHSRALTYLHLALIESELAKRLDAPPKLLNRVVAHLTEAAREDEAGRRQAVVLGGLTQILENVTCASARLSPDDVADVDRVFAELFRAYLAPFAGRAPKPSHYADAVEGLGYVNDLVRRERLPRLREAFDDFNVRFGAARAARKMH